jgi:hypothetical protein
MRRLLLILPTLLLSLALLAPPAGAKYHVAVGIGDESASIFEQAPFRALHIKKVRYFIRWDAMKSSHGPRAARLIADNYVAQARKAHVRVLMHISTNDLRHKRAHLPSTKSYRKWVGRLVRHFRHKGVKEWGVWNEANHKSQPTYKNPKRAAQYFKVMRKVCHRCTIVALDVLDQAGVTRYIDRWYRALGRSYRHRATIVGIHNYSDTNRYRSRGTRSILRRVRHYNRHTRFWLTETGGVVNFGRSFPCSQKRAAKAVSYMFSLVKRFRSSIKRLYAYNYFGTYPQPCQGFDAGLVNGNGSPRPGYAIFKSRARSYSR